MLRVLGWRHRRREEEGCQMHVGPQQGHGDWPPHTKEVPSGDHPVRQDAGDKKGRKQIIYI